MKILPYLKLVRVQNLVIIVLTMYMMRYFVVQPLLVMKGFSLQFSSIHFLLLVLSTVFITAAGYVINDYFDRKTDMVNHPEEVIIGKVVNRRKAMALHLVFNALGVGLGVYLSLYIQIFSLAVIFVLIAGLLWFYSTSYKRQFLVGNIIVAVLTALVPIMVPLFEIPLLNKEYNQVLTELGMDFSFLLRSVGIFALFGFITTLMREIIKDSEDFEGDAAYGRNTVPIMLGIKNTKIIILSIDVLFIIGVLITYIKLKSFAIPDLFDQITMIYFVVGLVIPSALLGFKIYSAGSKKDYHFSSQLVKIIMLIGLCYSFVIKYFLF
ncbi:MAG: geranylgeranylglycerol-phosphate geranylgeranyltransferase [bacterium]